MTGTSGLLGWVGTSVLLIAWCVGCGGDSPSDTDAAAGGTTGTGGGATEGTGSAATGGGPTGGAGGSGSGGGDGSGGQASEPFSLEYGRCSPNPVPGPEPIYENTDTFAHIEAIVTHGDDLIFVESYDFNDPPPRIAKLDAGGSVSTVLDAGALDLAVYGDSLYLVDGEGLKTLDLTNPTAELEPQTLVSGILAFDDMNVVFSTETEVFSVAIGLGDDMSSAVNLGALGDVVRQPTISGGVLYYHDVDDVLALSLDGSGSTQVTPTDEFRYIWFMALGATHAYFDDNPLKAIPLTGGEPTVLGTAGPDGFGQDAGFTDLAPSGSFVYWADDNESWGWTAADGMSCAILGQHKGFFGGAVAVSTTYVYARGDAELYRVPGIE
jgi:hypothetical protein